jgi:hypothetical protein
MAPIDYTLTKIFETQFLVDIDETITSAFRHFENELPIVLTHIDETNWTLLTTRQIISNINSKVKETLIENVIQRKWNDFKGFKDKSTTLGQLTLVDNTTLDFIIETGKASMVIIYGIMTLTGKETSTKEQINKPLNENKGYLLPIRFHARPYLPTATKTFEEADTGGGK